MKTYKKTPPNRCLAAQPLSHPTFVSYSSPAVTVAPQSLPLNFSTKFYIFAADFRHNN